MSLGMYSSGCKNSYWDALEVLGQDSLASIILRLASSSISLDCITSF